MSSPPGDDAERGLKKTMTKTTGVAYVVGTIIGSGIYSQPGDVLERAGCGVIAMGTWFLAGMIAMAGALCYCELAARFPNTAGAEVTYLREVYGDLSAFCFTWGNSLLSRPVSFSLICLIFGENCGTAFDIDPRIPASILLILLAVINGCSVESAFSLQRILSTIKVICLIAITILACKMIITDHDKADFSFFSFDSNSTDGTFSQSVTVMSSFIPALWAYDGWNSLCYAAAELKDISMLKSSIVIGLSLCISLYLLVNASYFIVVGRIPLRVSDSVAVDFLDRTIGSESSKFVASITVAISTFGAANGVLFAASRLVYSSALTGYLPPCLGGVSKNNSPVSAISCQTVVSVLLIFLSNSRDLVQLFGVVTFCFYFLNVFAILVLRRKERYLPSPQGQYRVSIVLPIVFCLFTVILIASATISDPGLTLAGFGCIASGVPVFYTLPMLRDKCLGRCRGFAYLIPVSPPQFQSTEMEVLPSDVVSQVSDLQQYSDLEDIAEVV